MRKIIIKFQKSISREIMNFRNEECILKRNKQPIRTISSLKDMGYHSYTMS